MYCVYKNIFNKTVNLFKDSFTRINIFKLLINKTNLLFLARFSQMKASGDYFVTVIEDTRKNEIIGAASLIIERKFIHNCAIVSKFE